MAVAVQVRASDQAYEIPAGLRNATDDQIRQMVKDAHPPTLRGTLYFLTGDEGLAGIEMTDGVGFLTSNGVQITRPQDLELLEEKAFALLKAYRDGKAVPPDPLKASPEHLLRAMEFMVGSKVPADEYGYWNEDFGFDPWARALQWENKPADKVAQFKVVVIGAGLSGLNAAIQLKRAGFSFTVFERNSGVGGTWFENSYPGARVDLASRIYSHLFGVNYPWQHMFATSKENKAYGDWCADHFDVRKSIRFNTTVEALTWDEPAGEWIVRVRRADGGQEEHRANGIISAGGLFDRPFYGDFPGADTFKGVTMHTARYDSKADLSNARVGVIGTGASAVQMVPDLAPDVKSITVFQRTAPWVLPLEGYRDELPAGLKWLDANMPFYTNFSRVATHWLAGDHDQWYVFTIDPEWKDEHTLNKDMHVFRQRCIDHIKGKVGAKPDLVEKCIPNYPPLTKRFVLDNGWYDALMRDNVELVTDPIDHIEADGIVTESGRKVEVDAIIFGTGYLPNAFLQPMDIHGRGGVTPQQVWAKDGARAYWGVTVPGLPNFFMLYGPGTNGKISGPLPWGEMQGRYALSCFKTLIETGKKSIEIKPEAYEAFNKELDRELDMSIWLDPRQKSYYQNEFGRSATNAPWKVMQLWTAWRKPNLDHYKVS